MADNRVVIKINYGNKKSSDRHIEPKMVTVWHTRRIAVVFFLISIIGTLFYLAANDEDDLEDLPLKSDQQSIVPLTPIQAERTPEAPKLPIPTADNINAKQLDVVKRPDAVILDKRVIRAALTSAPKHDEPGEPIKSPLIIESSQDRELFYFVQIKNMKGHILFHHWNREGQLVIKKQFLVKTNNDRLVSNRKLTAKDSGQWQVVLKDGKGKLFSEVNYSVNP